jgi:hypothetical protein
MAGAVAAKQAPAIAAPIESFPTGHPSQLQATKGDSISPLTEEVNEQDSKLTEKRVHSVT